MFATLIKNVGNRHSERYFQNWQNAEKALQEQLSEAKKRGARVTSDINMFNQAHGYYDRYAYLELASGEKMTLAITESYFEDEVTSESHVVKNVVFQCEDANKKVNL